MTQVITVPSMSTTIKHAPAVLNDPLITEYAERIGIRLSRAAGTLIEIGREFAEAKQRLDEPSFGELCKCLGYSNRAAVTKWVKIGEQYERYAPHAHVLPSSWTTLYELSKLTDDEFTRCVMERRICESMKRPTPADLAQLRHPIVINPSAPSDGVVAGVSTAANAVGRQNALGSGVITITVRFDAAADRSQAMVCVKQVCEELKRLSGVRVNCNAVTEIDPNQTAKAA